MTEALIALTTLTAMEIVLGIDNVIFIAVLAGRLPKAQQASARRLGLLVALVTRLGLLATLFYLSHLDSVEVLRLTSLGVPAQWLPQDTLKEVDAISIKDLVLLLGGVFLIAKSTMEIHHKLEGDEEERASTAAASFAWVIVEIAVIDIVFSLDSVITAVGMARDIWIMVLAMVIALVVMLIFSGYISNFVARHPTIKVLALAFLILIGVMLVVEGFEGHINKGYIYFAMAFSIAVETLNIRLRARRKSREPVHLRKDLP